MIFTYISWLASLHIVKVAGLADNYPLNLTFPLVFKFVSISETWFWILALSAAGFLVLSIKTTPVTANIKNTIKVDKKAAKALQKALKTPETPKTEEAAKDAS